MEIELRLIKKIKKKNCRESSDKLISKYYKEVYIYVYKQTSSKELSMDLAQEIFISILKSINNFDESKASFRTWVYKIATNKVVDYYRSKNYKYTTLIESIENIQLENNEDFTVKFDYKEDIGKIQEIVNKLNTEYQEIFRLKIFLDATFAEIASILKIPESTVKTKYYSIIRRIKKAF